MIKALSETAEDITDPTDARWMYLLIDIDRNKEAGWEGYDYIVNRVQPTSTSAVLESSITG